MAENYGLSDLVSGMGRRAAEVGEGVARQIVYNLEALNASTPQQMALRAARSPSPVSEMTESPFGVNSPDLGVQVGAFIADPLNLVGVPGAGRAARTAGREAVKFGARGVEAYLDTPVGSALRPRLTAYHGSPHKFDKFKMEKIGTGEGAQAYGHGLYFAENPAVAKEYSKMSPAGPIPPMRRAFKGMELEPGTWEYKAASLADELGLPKSRKLVSEWIQNAKPTDDVEGFKTVLQTLNSASSKADFKNLGNSNLYKVDLPDEQVAKFLDWDKPLSQQPEGVRKALKDSGLAKEFRENLSDFSSHQTTRGAGLGHNLHSYIVAKFGGDEAKASEYLRTIGVPGIKYLDQGSRNSALVPYWNLIREADGVTVQQVTKKPGTVPAGFRLEGPVNPGTSNFVVFDENLPKILERK